MVMQPLFNYSLEDQAGRYPKLFENYTYEAKVNQGSKICGPQGVETSVDLMTEIIAERTWFPDPSDLTVILAPLCAPSFAVIGDFARDRFPSTVSFAMADTGLYGATVLVVMRYYLWKSIAIISDQLSGSAKANRNVEQCRAPLELLYERRSEFEFLNIITDSSKENFTRALITATMFSRGESSSADAYDLEMMKGDYVSSLIHSSFILKLKFNGSYSAKHSLFLSTTLPQIFLHLYGIEVPGEPPLSWFRNDSLDVKVQAAFQHLLVVSSPPIDWKEFEEPSRLMHQRREIMFGEPTTPYERNEFEVTCYEAVVTVAKVRLCGFHGVV
ncbi:hypothetical protein BV898_15827 [Hypsibius exemplaris]|uniref:Receptor ligand binding region domain-containing protein n=1 Tax=Hypsibius exemplaris TaxID=2072580 RepID=A0A9X6NIH4_HYPEX|nr:hypothetical protein BV898_15827 [Hypsibius exemplaris]